MGLSMKDKLAIVIEEVLDACHKRGYSLNSDMERMYVAGQLVDRLLEGREQYRSGRRLSDRLKDKLISVQGWFRRS